jgi:hypothetical protein
MAAVIIRARVRSPLAPAGRPNCDRAVFKRRTSVENRALIDRSIIFDGIAISGIGGQDARVRTSRWRGRS